MIKPYLTWGHPHINKQGFICPGSPSPGTRQRILFNRYPPASTAFLLEDAFSLPDCPISASNRFRLAFNPWPKQQRDPQSADRRVPRLQEFNEQTGVNIPPGPSKRGADNYGQYPKFEGGSGVRQSARSKLSLWIASSMWTKSISHHEMKPWLKPIVR